MKTARERRREIVSSLVPGKTRVRWISQAGGRKRTKAGLVVYAGRGFHLFREGPHFDRGTWDEGERELFVAAWSSTGRVRADACSWGVVVRVERFGKSGKPLPPYYYCPNPNQFTVIEEGDA